MATATSPTLQSPQYDVTLSDGSTTVGFILADTNGQPYPLAIQRNPINPTAIKTSTGESKYSDLVLPYQGIEQKDWSGGRGQLNFEDDTSRFYDSYRATTWKDGVVLGGGRETYGKGYRSVDESSNNAMTSEYDLLSTTLYLSAPFTCSGSGAQSRQYVDIYLRRTGTPGSVVCAVYTNSSGSPGTSVDSVSVDPDSITKDSTYVRYRFDLGTFSLTGGTAYHVVVYDSGTPTASNYWTVGCITSAGKRSANGSSWTTTTYSPYFRITGADTAGSGMFFEYKRQMYFVSTPTDGSQSVIYMNGDRGAADSNSGDKSKLNDASKSATWVADEWAGCIALIIAGPGSEEAIPWRTISSNTTTALSVYTAWNVAHTTDTEYVILKSNKWTSYETLTSKTVTDLTVAGDYVLFACGFNDNGARYTEYNNSGTWTKTVTSIFNCQNILAIPKEDGYYNLWATYREYDEPLFWSAPQHVLMYTLSPGGNYYCDHGEVCPTDIPWDSRSVTSVTTQDQVGGRTRVVVNNAFTTGVIAVHDLDDPVDLRKGDGFIFNIRSSEGYDSGQLDLVWDDGDDLRSYAKVPLAVHYFDNSAGGFEAATSTDVPCTYPGNMSDGSLTTYSTVTVDDATDIIYVLGDYPFESMTIYVGASVNNNVVTMTAWYWNGGGWTSFGTLGANDGTRVDTGGGNYATLGQDGTVSWTVPYDWREVTINGTTGYAAAITFSGALDAVTIENFFLNMQNNESAAVSSAALVADRWHEAFITGQALNSFPYPDCSAIKSFGLRIDTDQDITHTIYLDRGIHLISSDKPQLHIPIGNQRINRLIAYKNPNGVTVPWIICDSSIYYVDTENDNALVPLPIGEISLYADENNGIAACVNDVYLYFSLGDKIERYFDRTLEDIGPDRTDVDPYDLYGYRHAGTPACLLSIPGKVIAAMDGGDSHYSSVILSPSGQNWHEVYRAPRPGKRIKNIALQNTPDSTTQRIWISEGDDILWVSYSPNPIIDPDYTFTHEAYIETSYINTSIYSMQKVWDSLRIVADGLTSTANQVSRIFVDYKKDSDTTWTAIGTSYYTSPEQENDISSASPPNLKGKKIRFRIVLRSMKNQVKLLASILDCYGVVPIKYSYSFNSAITDGVGLVKDLNGQDDITLGQYATSAVAGAALDAWATAATPLTMRNRLGWYDNKTVVINGVSSRPAERKDDFNQVERYLINVVCNEL